MVKRRTQKRKNKKQIHKRRKHGGEGPNEDKNEGPNKDKNEEANEEAKEENEQKKKDEIRLSDIIFKPVIIKISEPSLINKNYRVKYSDNTTYSGDFENDQKEGYGVLKDASNNIIYEGQWHNDLKHGEGTFFYPLYYEIDNYNKKNKFSYLKIPSKYKTDSEYIDKQTQYKGQWQNDIKQGEGTMTYANGDTITSIWNGDESSIGAERKNEQGNIAENNKVLDFCNIL
jgi:hypothetical protein